MYRLLLPFALFTACDTEASNAPPVGDTPPAMDDTDDPEPDTDQPAPQCPEIDVSGDACVRYYTCISDRCASIDYSPEVRAECAGACGGPEFLSQDFLSDWGLHCTEAYWAEEPGATDRAPEDYKPHWQLCDEGLEACIKILELE